MKEIKNQMMILLRFYKLCLIVVFVILLLYLTAGYFDTVFSITLPIVHELDSVYGDNQKPEHVRDTVVIEAMNKTDVGGFKSNMFGVRKNPTEDEHIPESKCSSSQRTTFTQKMCALRHPEMRPPSASYSHYSDAEVRSLAKRNFIVDHNHKIVLCYSGKAGATNFKMLLYRLNQHGPGRRARQVNRELGINPQAIHALWARADGLYPLHMHGADSIRHILSTYHKVMVVRHPLARLLSYFNDKFRGGSHHNHTDCHQVDSKLGQAIASLYKRLRPGEFTDTDIICGNKIRYLDFINLFTQYPMRDNHVEPFSNRCSPCQIQYDQIVKLETSGSDQIEMLRNVYNFTSDAEAQMFIKLIPTHSSANTTRLDHAYSNVTQKSVEFIKEMESYGGIDVEPFEKLKVIYRDDLELFGYRAELEDGKVKLDCNGNGNCC